MSFSSDDLLKFGATFLAGGAAAYVIVNVLMPKIKDQKDTDDCVNKCIDKGKAKCVDFFEIEDLPDQIAFCRCWRSAKFPYCDGTHNGHNKLTGDNVGPLVMNRKASS